jgi:ubiquinone/menaquinone biosynthesis C-methylase UbiE
LEIGCGTGSLLIEVKRQHPSAHVVGLDPDPKALGRARRKAERTGLSIELDQAYSDEMPYPDASFDRVLSSFMFHHLEPDTKVGTLREVHRVLRPGGGLELLDFAPSSRPGGLARWLHSSEHLKENAEERVLGLMRQAGFDDALKTGEGRMLFGHVAVKYYQAKK